ncbi:hypothetical protein LINPERHAP1_LOCUS11775 [Linum perenne]
MESPNIAANWVSLEESVPRRESADTSAAAASTL